MKYVKKTMSLKDKAEMEYMHAKVSDQEEKIEINMLLTKYVAEMNDIYIPEEAEENVQNTVET